MIVKFTADIKAAVLLIIAENISVLREVVRKAANSITKSSYKYADMNRNDIKDLYSRKQRKK